MALALTCLPSLQHGARAPSSGLFGRKRSGYIHTRRMHLCAQLNTRESSPATGQTTPGAGSREFFSLLPPFTYRTTTFQEFQPGLYGLTQPLALGSSFDIRLRMTVSKLGDGSLLLVGPIAPTGEMISILDAIEGPVKHIVLPNTSPEHWYFAPALAQKFPRATVWTVPGLWEGDGFILAPLFLSKMRQSSVCRVLGVDPLPPELQGEIDWVVYKTFLFVEAAIILQRYRTLLLTDTGLFMDPQEYAGAGAKIEEAAKKMGIWGRLGPSITKAAFERGPEEGRRWVEAVLEKDFEDIVVLHTSAPSPAGGKQALREAYDFLF